MTITRTRFSARCQLANLAKQHAQAGSRRYGSPIVTAVTMGDLGHCRNSQLCAFPQTNSGSILRRADAVHFYNLWVLEMRRIRTITRRHRRHSRSGNAVCAAFAQAVVRKLRELTMKKGILFDSTLCVGCGACYQASKEKNNLPPTRADYLTDKLSSKTYTVVKLRSGRFIRQMCMHCETPTCAATSRTPSV